MSSSTSWSTWSICRHTCLHEESGHSRVDNANERYSYHGEVIVVGAAPVRTSHHSKWRDHVVSSVAHPHCTPQCPMHRYRNAVVGTLNAADVKRSLTIEEWKKWGLAIALASGSVSWKQVPEVYREKARQFLRRDDSTALWVEDTDEDTDNENEQMDVDQNNTGMDVDDDEQAEATQVQAQLFDVAGGAGVSGVGNRKAPIFPDNLSLQPGQPRIRLLFVESVHHWAHGSDTLYHHHDVLPQDIADTLKAAFPGQIEFLPKRNIQKKQQWPYYAQLIKNPVVVNMDDWTYFVAGAMQRPEFDVRFMLFKEFSDTVSMGNWDNRIMGAEMIFASVEFSDDFLRPDNPSGWTKASFKVFFEQLLKLARKKLVFPSPWESLISADKITYLTDIGRIATKAGYLTPMISRLDPTQLEEDEEISPNVVYKRGYDECSGGVWFRSRGSVDHRRTKTLLQMVKEIEENYGGLKINGIPIRPQWFQMTFLPTMSKVGELRVYFIGGEVTHIVNTINEHEVDLMDVMYPTPLDALPGALSDGGLNIKDMKRGKKEFLAFARTMLIGLIEVREARGHVVSDLRSFCRIDVAVFKAEDNKYHYFVSEIEAGPGTGMFLTAIDMQRRVTVRNTMVDVWRTRVLSRRAGNLV
ncbi:hypothetical protein DXG01_005881 [Tephrocybe rancida]|nr:hypothetical protein DXG01_005881 [Tephrocybe rancida]